MNAQRNASQMCIRDRQYIPNVAAKNLVAKRSGIIDVFVPESIDPVSYTHLDVYKRQDLPYLERQKRLLVHPVPHILFPVQFFAQRRGLQLSGHFHFVENRTIKYLDFRRGRRQCIAFRGEFIKCRDCLLYTSRCV